MSKIVEFCLILSLLADDLRFNLKKQSKPVCSKMAISSVVVLFEKKQNNFRKKLHLKQRLKVLLNRKSVMFIIWLWTGTKAGVEKRNISVETPLINLSKWEIITTGERLGVPFKLTWSCYKGGKTPCGKCDSCYYRAKGFKEAGISDLL